jgi:competence protein ComEA
MRHRNSRMLAGLCIVVIALFMLPGFVGAGEKININTADKDKLCELTGIGPAIADRIIEYREKHGPFKSVDELTQVKGIGEGTLQKIKDLVAVE